MPWSFCRGRRYFRARPQEAYEFNDEFVVPDANPLSAQPRICEPGPGVLQWLDLDGRLSVNFGALTFTGASGAWDRTALHTEFQSWARRRGRYLEFEWTPLVNDSMRVGWQRGSTLLIADSLAMIYFGGGATVNVVDEQDTMETGYPYSAATYSYRCRVVDTGTGFLYYIRRSIDTDWTVLWHKPLSMSRLTPIRIGIQNIAQTGTMQYLRIGNAPLRPPSIIRQPANNELYCGAASGLLDVTFLTPASGAPGLIYRYQDAQNYWRVEIDKTAGEVQLIKKVANADTTVATYADEPNTGDTVRLRILFFGSSHRVFIAQNRVIAATDAALSTAEGIGTLGGGVTYTDLRFDSSGALAS